MFGGLAERAVAEEVLDLPGSASTGDLMSVVYQRYPEIARFAGQIRTAVNQQIASADQVLYEDDEVALLPPVAGGAHVVTGLRESGFSVSEALDAVGAPDAGGTVVFVGTVRDHAEDWGRVDRLEYSAYRKMAEPVLRQVAEEAAGKWPLAGICILHGLGDLLVGDHTVVVAASSPHRGDAFEACRYAIDEVKVRVPVWKKEKGPGGHRWVGLEPQAPDGADGASRAPAG